MASLRSLCVVVSVVVVLSHVTYSSSSSSCNPTLPLPASVRVAQTAPPSSGAAPDVYIGGVFAVHEKTAWRHFLCKGAVDPQAVQRLEAFLWAVETLGTRYRDDPRLMDLTFGAIAIDSCSDSDHVTQLLSDYESCHRRFVSSSLPSSTPSADPRRTLAYVGLVDDDAAVRAGAFLGHVRKPALSVGATVNVLVDDDRFPNVFRMMPSDNEQAHLLVELLKGIRPPSSSSWWNYVHIVSTDDLVGESATESFLLHASEEGVVVATTQSAPPSASDDDLDLVVNKLKTNREARAVVVLAKQGTAAPGNPGSGFCTRLLRAAHRQRVGPDFTFIFGSGCGHIHLEALHGPVNSEALGSLGLVYDEGALPAFQAHYRSLRPSTRKANPWFGEFWEQTFGCRLVGVAHPRNESGTHSAPTAPCDISDQYLTPTLFRQDPFVPATVAAVDAAAFAAADAVRRLCRGVGGALCPEALERTEELKSLVAKKLKEVVDERAKTKGGDVLKVVNFQMEQNKHRIKKIAQFRSGVLHWIPEASLQLYDSDGAPRSYLPSECRDAACAAVDGGSSGSSTLEEILERNLVGGDLTAVGPRPRGSRRPRTPRRHLHRTLPRLSTLPSAFLLRRRSAAASGAAGAALLRRSSGARPRPPGRHRPGVRRRLGAPAASVSGGVSRLRVRIRRRDRRLLRRRPRQIGDNHFLEIVVIVVVVVVVDPVSDLSVSSLLLRRRNPNRRLSHEIRLRRRPGHEGSIVELASVVFVVHLSIRLHGIRDGSRLRDALGSALFCSLSLCV